MKVLQRVLGPTAQPDVVADGRQVRQGSRRDPISFQPRQAGPTTTGRKFGTCSADRVPCDNAMPCQSPRTPVCLLMDVQLSA